MDEPTQEQEPPKPSPKRKKILVWMSAGFASIGLCAFVYWLIWGQYSQYTDDAYVSGNLVFVTPQVSGIVTDVYIDNAQRVNQGHKLITLDQTDFLISLEEAKAHLATEIRNVAQMFLQAKQAIAMVEVAKAKLKTAAQDFERRTGLICSGSVSQENFDHSENSLSAAFFSLAAAEATHASLFVQIDKTTVEKHPRVKLAEEKLKRAWVALKRTTIKAPTHGLIAERTVQVGQRVSPGEPLFSIVPLDQIWVDANFKEVQIGKMQIGQPVSLYSDIYGSSVQFHGYIQGIGGGTGSVFSVLPPQNATGNWIKIVQRVPIRIKLDSEEIKKHPLRLGLSMEVTADIHDIGNSSIPFVAPTHPLYKTRVFDDETEGSQEVIDEIYRANMPKAEIVHAKIEKI